MKKISLLLCCVWVACSACVANDKKEIKQSVYPQCFDNVSFATVFFNADKVYEIRGKELFSGETIDYLTINPAYTSIATLQHNKKRKKVVFYRVNPYAPNNSSIVKVKDAQPVSVAYSADARRLAVAFSDGNINMYDPQKYQLFTTYASKLTPSKLVFSDNNYFLGAASEDTLEIWNTERGTIRKTLKMESRINDFCFSNNSSQLWVLTANGKLFVYDTKSFELQCTIDELGQAVSCAPSNTGKYAAVVQSPQLISVVNILDPTERHMVVIENGGVTRARILYHQFTDKNYVLYNKHDAIVFEEVEGMTPYYNKMMSFELNERLNQWTKQMPDETMEEYQLRVNDATRMEQAKLIEREVATRMATGMIEGAEFSVGDYYPTTNSLALKFNTMPDILLEVPVSDVNAFNSDSKLEFHNAKYSLNPDDKFELVYVEVFNPDNGKTYVFDNQEHRALSQMTMEADFVPLEIVQKSNMEETALMNIKEDIFNVAKQENVLSDKTHISVKTEAVNAVNADGERIVNYNVDFTYEVDEQFSARDDFKPGRYHVEESAAAKIMLRIMTEAFEKDFAKYMVDGKRVKIKVKGTADASPINHTLPYDGKYGEYDGEPVYMNNELSNITLNKKEGIATNEQLAFARALGVQHYIEKEISSIGNMKRDYEYHIEVSKEEGSKFRRISVQYTFIDAF